MLGRVHRVFLRYCEGRIRLDGQGGPFVSKDQRTTGDVEFVTLEKNRLTVSGKVGAPEVAITVSQMSATAMVGVDGRFSIDLPAASGPIVARTQDAVARVDGIEPAALRRARLGQLGPFVATMIACLPDIWRWKRQGDMGARNRVKERLGLVAPSYAIEINAGALTEEATPIVPGGATVTIILPVYNAVDVLREALDRVARNTDIPWRMVLIEDCSTDPDVRPMVQEWAKAQGDRVTLLLNDANLGFIATVNRGLAQARTWSDAPIVLLNSDALVPEGWTSRLLAPIWADDGVATVTPLSNDAEIYSVPVPGVRHDLDVGDGDGIDALMGRCGALGHDISAPTGVGFCMALAPHFIAQIPDLDVTFGRGYGEETDWCQKAMLLGGRHVAAGNLFVEHRGGASFGSAAKQKLLERNGAIIRKRYPDYDASVLRFMRDDPLITARLAAAFAWAAVRQTGPVPVYIAHALGGGAEAHLQGQLNDDLTQGCAAVIVRVGIGHHWQIEMHARLPNGERHATMGLTNDDAALRALVDMLPRRRIIYSCGVGARDAFALPDIIVGIAMPDDTVDVLVHDFFPISPSYTLLGSDGHYHGVPVAGANAAADRAHSYRRPDGSVVDVAKWQDAWGRLVLRADHCTVFSHNSADLLTQVYPFAAGKVRVIPHAPDLPDLQVTQPRSDPPVIGVLGNIGSHKGAGVIQQLSRDLSKSGKSKLVVIGHLDPAYKLAAPSFAHGAYQVEDLPKLAARYGITGWFMPSIWPETFSFVIHEVLATGLPVTCFDIGAQADAVRAQGWQVLALPEAGVHVRADDVLRNLKERQK